MISSNNLLKIMGFSFLSVSISSCGSKQNSSTIDNANLNPQLSSDTDLQNKINELQKNIDSLSKEKNQIQSKLDNMQNDNELLLKVNQDDNDEIQSLKDKISNQTININDQSKDLALANEKLEKNIKELKEKSQQLLESKLSNEELIELFNDLKQKHTNSESLLKKSLEKNDELTNKISKLEIEYNNLKNKLIDNDSKNKLKIQEIEKKYNEVKNELKSTQEDKVKIENTLKETATRLKEVEDLFSKYKETSLHDNSELQSKLNIINSKYDELNKNYDKLKNEKNEISDNAKAEKVKNEELIKELSDLKEEYTKLKNSNTSSESEYKSKIEDLNKKINELELKVKSNLVSSENCSDLGTGNRIDKLKKTLCANSQRLNKGDLFVNAYSNMWEANIQLGSNGASQDSFNQILNNGTFMPLWGVSEWINKNELPKINKIFAFGELSVNDSTPRISFNFDEFGRIENKKWGIWDIRFVDNTGKIWVASGNAGMSEIKTKNSYKIGIARYSVEADLGSEYVNKVYGAFVKKPQSENIYFLKKDGTYDLKKASKYITIKDGRTDSLFPMIPSSEIKYVDFIQKVSGDQIALYKKVDGHYTGFFLIPTKEVDESLNSKSKATFVSFVK